MNIYNSEFYNTYKNVSLNSANELVPIITKILNPKSVLDIGCGVGTWLKQFQDAGITDYNGVDGPYVKKEQFLANKDKLIHHDLQTTLDLQKKYDIVISLEVAEHIDEKYADIFIDNLTRHSDCIVMSAAIPLQGGTYHVNEQWPDYWIRKMNIKGFKVYDLLRPIIWNNSAIDYYYRQNILVYSKFDIKVDSCMNQNFYSFVHPEKWLQSRNYKNQSLKFVLKALPYSIVNAIKNRL
ncbi:MAG: methyltransferase domain-containing protein [Rickettsiaceae bacterium]|nr:methyltransferase domain-containing protein [Rickettsiaceae bacterium]